MAAKNKEFRGMKAKTRSMLRMLGACLAGVAVGPVDAATDRYDYDALGRVIQRVDDQARSTDYVYDPVGNLLKVSTPDTVQPLAITSGPIGDQRRNEIRQIAVSGTGLAGVTIRTSHPGISISQLTQSATSASFRLAVSNLVPLGPHVLTFAGPGGAAQLPFNVLPAIAFVLMPQPVGIAPDNVARKVSLYVTDPLPATRTFTLSILPSTVAKTDVTQVTFLAGQSQAGFGVIGLAEGTALLRLSDPGLVDPLEFMVFVSAQQLVNSPRVGTSRGLPVYTSPTALVSSTGVGLVRTVPWSYTNGVMDSSAIGLVRGPSWRVAPTVNPLVAPLVGIVRP